MTMKPIFRQSSFYYVQWQVIIHPCFFPSKKNRGLDPLLVRIDN